jgi:hypothetical protein
MAATTRIHVLKNAIVDGLSLRSGLAGVQITSAFIGDQLDARESIQLALNDEITGDWAQVGKFSRNETITVTGIVTVDRPGAGETVIRECRQRAAELMAEIESFVVADPSIGAVVLQAKVRPTMLAEGFSPEGRWALLRFEIEAFSRLTTS